MILARKKCPLSSPNNWSPCRGDNHLPTLLICNVSLLRAEVYPPNSHAKALNPHVTTFNDTIFKEAIMVKWGHKGGVLSHRTSVLFYFSNNKAFYLTASSPSFSSVTQSCPTLCDPMDCSTLGLPVHHQLPRFTQTHVHQVDDAIQPSYPLLSPSPPALNLSQHQGLFKWVSS